MSDQLDGYFMNLKNPKHFDDLQELRGFLQSKLPGATEDLTYSMPTYSLGGDIVVAMASQKNYISLYMDMELVENHRSELGKLNCGKSCIRFKKLEELPLDVIDVILQETVEKQAAEREGELKG